MTQIHISIRKPKTGGLDPVTGLMRFRPVRRHFDAAKNLIIAASFDADLSESGELTVDLLPTTPAFVWQVVELADSPQAYTRNPRRTGRSAWRSSPAWRSFELRP